MEARSGAALVAPMKLGVTGGTGFVGSHLLDAAVAAGHQVKALTRREQPKLDGVEWIAGDLDDRAALQRLVTEADAVIHIAGVITRRECGGVRARQCRWHAGHARRRDRGRRPSLRPRLLACGARTEAVALRGVQSPRGRAGPLSPGLEWAIVRPPAVYGPGDKETLELFRMAKLGLMLMPPNGRLSLIHVDDLARLLLALADPIAPSSIIIEAG